MDSWTRSREVEKLKRAPKTQRERHRLLREQAAEVHRRVIGQYDAVRLIFGAIDNGKPIELARVLLEAACTITSLSAQLRQPK